MILSGYLQTDKVSIESFCLIVDGKTPLERFQGRNGMG